TARLFSSENEMSRKVTPRTLLPGRLQPISATCALVLRTAASPSPSPDRCSDRPRYWRLATTRHRLTGARHRHTARAADDRPVDAEWAVEAVVRKSVLTVHNHRRTEPKGVAKGERIVRIVRIAVLIRRV